jgi:hypothetical protein
MRRISADYGFYQRHAVGGVMNMLFYCDSSGGTTCAALCDNGQYAASGDMRVCSDSDDFEQAALCDGGDLS